MTSVMACARPIDCPGFTFMTDSPDTLLKTPLHDLHLALGARMVPFAG